MLEQDQLLACDIVLSTTDQFPSRVIRFGTNSEVSHAILYWGLGNCIEAVPPVVRVVTLKEALAESHTAVVLRVPQLTQREMGFILGESGRYRNEPFDPVAALCACNYIYVGGLPGGGIFCSKLVALSYLAAGIRLADGHDPENTAPADIRNATCSRLHCIGYLKHPSKK